MSEILSGAVLPTQDNDQSLQGRLRELRSRLEPQGEQDKASLRKACQDFEAVFIGQIWKQMRSSVPKEGMLHSKEEESYLSMFDQELSLKMSRSGGIGLGDLLYENLSQRLVNASRDTSSARPLEPLDRGALAALEARASTPVRAGTLAALTAQRQAENLARRIEQAHLGGPAQELSDPSLPSELEDALRAVRMDASDEI